MASPLDLIQKAVQSGFKGKLRTASLRRVTPGSGVDELGDALAGSSALHEFDGIRETFSATFRAGAGIPQDDVQIMLIARRGSVSPRQGDQVLIEGLWHEVRAVLDIDPAGATFKLQAFVIPDPTV